MKTMRKLKLRASACKILKNQKAVMCFKNIQKQEDKFMHFILYHLDRVSRFTSSFSTLQLAGKSKQEQILSLSETFQTLLP